MCVCLIQSWPSNESQGKSNECNRAKTRKSYYVPNHSVRLFHTCIQPNYPAVVIDSIWIFQFSLYFKYILMPHSMLKLYHHIPYFHASNSIYCLYSALILSFYIDVVLTLSIQPAFWNTFILSQSQLRWVWIRGNCVYCWAGDHSLLIAR